MNLLALPDRGFNTPDQDQYCDYPTRVHRLRLHIAAGGGAALAYVSSQYVRDAHGALTTGLDPGSGAIQHLGVPAPSPPPAFPGQKRRLALDSEGLAAAASGRMYISEELSCSIYRTTPDGQIDGVIPAPPSIRPQKRGRAHFTSHDDDPPDTGRMPNDGLEGLSLDPSGKTLFALMQSALAQDRKTTGLERRHVRLLTFDVTGADCPTRPSGHYAVKLPLYSSEPAGQADKISEANCVLALDRSRFLVLARDGRGFGARRKADPKKDLFGKPIRFKQILLGRIDGATNLAGTRYDQDTRALLKDGALRNGITAISLAPFIDLCDEAALNRVKLTTKPAKRGYTQISAKWESLCLTPPLGPRSRERFLLVGNDNDFQTRRGFMPDGAYDGGAESPNMILIYRVMIP